MNNYSVSLKLVQQMMELASDNDIDYEVFEGSLNDNYIFYSDKWFKLPHTKRTNYIIIEEKFLNTWSSDLILTVTDDYKKVEEFKNKFINTEESIYA